MTWGAKALTSMLAGFLCSPEGYKQDEKLAILESPQVGFFFSPTLVLPGSKGSFVQAAFGPLGISFLGLCSYKGTHGPLLYK